MFEFFQRHKKLLQIILFVLIVPSFVIVGLEGYMRMGDGGGTVATLNGNIKISNAEFDHAHKNAIDRIRQNNPTVDIKLLDSPEFKQSTLDQLIMQRLQTLAAQDSHLVVPDAILVKTLRADPNVAALVGADGKLDSEKYKAYVASMGRTPEQHEAAVRADLAARQVFAPITGSGILSKSTADLVTQSFFQKREVQVLLLKTSDYLAQIKPTDTEVEAYYQAHPKQFEVPESANIEYLVLDQEAINKGLTISEEQLKEYYTNNAARLSQVGTEERRASHILIAVPQGASKADKDAAMAKAKALQAEAAKAPNNFAQLAKSNSQDDGSAPSGGDLGFFGKGMMTKAFEDAAFALKAGEVSGVVETEFGYHIIKLAEVKIPKAKTYEELKPGIEIALRQQLAQQKYAEMAEQFSNMVYEQADGLKEVADKFKLPLQTATALGRNPGTGAKGVLANPKFLTAIFSNESITKKRNTEAVDLGSSQLASGRIIQYNPTKAAPFAEVKDKARVLLVQSRAEEMAKSDGAKKLQEAKAAADGGKLPTALVIGRDKPQNQPSKVITAALSADPSQLPATVGVDLGTAGYAVVRVNKVLADGGIDPAQISQRQTQIAQTWTQSEALAYYELLKARYKVETKPFAAAAVDGDGVKK